jgi:hypothetical protein
MIDKSDMPLGTLFSDLTRDVVDLVRHEIALAKREMTAKMADAQSAATSVAIGAAVLLAGLILILMAVVKGLEMLLPPEVGPWLSPLLVGGIVVAIGYSMLKGGKSRLSADMFIPHRTIDSLRRDKVVAQEKMQ